jgi:hypothetical protein
MQDLLVSYELRRLLALEVLLQQMPNEPRRTRTVFSLGVELGFKCLRNLNGNSRHFHKMPPYDSMLLFNGIHCQLSFTNVDACDTFRPMSKLKDPNEPAGSWVFRDIPRDLMIKMKIAAAVQRKSVKQLLIDLSREHIEELEKKGLLPKSK